MKRKITALILALVLCLGTVAGISMTASRDVAAKKETKEVKNLKKLQKALKKRKKKKVSKSFKTETGGTESIKYAWLKHKAAVQVKGKKIVFTDTVKYQDRDGKKVYTYNITKVKMIMNVGSNKKVTVFMKNKYKTDIYDKDYEKIIGHKWVNERTSSTSFKPAAYKKGIDLKWNNTDSGSDTKLFTCFRCWNSLVKKGKVSMKSIGFKKFKPVSIEEEAYYN